MSPAPHLTPEQARALAAALRAAMEAMVKLGDDLAAAAPRIVEAMVASRRGMATIIECLPSHLSAHRPEDTP